MNPKVDVYFTAGCGRCPLGNTPECKVHRWDAELEKLREIVLTCGLREELKWGVPTYTFEKKNIVVFSALNENCTLSFFKGALLKDDKKVLTKPGENTQAGRVIRFYNVQEVIEKEKIIKDYIKEAVEIEKSGLKFEFKPTSEYEIPAELQNKLDADSSFKKAFDALTPGRQRGYILHFSQPKQSATRISRIEKYTPKIIEGKGLNDR